MALFRLEGGRIVELWGTADRMSMLTQLGLLPDIGGVAAGWVPLGQPPQGDPLC